MKKAIRIIAAVLVGACLAPAASGCAGKTDPGDKVYRNSSYAGESVFFTIAPTLLLSGYMSKPDNIYPACIDPLCDHSTADCAAKMEGPITARLTVLPEGRRLPIVYMSCVRFPMKTVDGEDVVLSEYEQEMSVVRQFDAETGQAKTFDPVELTNIRSMLLYKGVLYLSADGFLGKGARGRVGALDVRTGVCTYLEEDDGARVIGICGGRIYFMTGRGAVKSCGHDFSDIRAEYDCGTGAFAEAYVDAGTLYFARSSEDVTAGDETERVYDVCAVKLDGEGGAAENVASGVRLFMPYEGDLYYTVLDYRECGTVSVPWYGEKKVVSYDGGTLYRYDAEKGASEACFTDIGVSFWDIYDIDGGVILFAGEKYRDFDENEETYMRIVVCELGTGEWRQLFANESQGGYT